MIDPQYLRIVSESKECIPDTTVIIGDGYSLADPKNQIVLYHNSQVSRNLV